MCNSKFKYISVRFTQFLITNCSKVAIFVNFQVSINPRKKSIKNLIHNKLFNSNLRVRLLSDKVIQACGLPAASDNLPKLMKDLKYILKSAKIYTWLVGNNLTHLYGKTCVFYGLLVKITYQNDLKLASINLNTNLFLVACPCPWQEEHMFHSVMIVVMNCKTRPGHSMYFSL